MFTKLLFLLSTLALGLSSSNINAAQNPPNDLARTYKLFTHNIRLIRLLGQANHYTFLTGDTIGTMTKDPALDSNYAFFATKDDETMAQLKETGLRFTCYPLETMHYEKQWFLDHSLTYDYDLCVQHIDKLQSRSFQETPITSMPIEAKPFSIIEVKTEEDLQRFDTIASQVFQDPEGQTFKELKSLLNNPEITIFITVTEKNEPIGCGLIAVINSLPGLYWGGILPSFRRQGYAVACTFAGLQLLKNLGYDEAVTFNVPEAVHLCQLVGFKPIGTIPKFSYGYPESHS